MAAAVAVLAAVAAALGEFDRRWAAASLAEGCSGPAALLRRQNRPPSALEFRGGTR